MAYEEDRHFFENAITEENLIDPEGDLQTEANYLRGMVGKLQHYTDINVGTNKRSRPIQQNRSNTKNNRKPIYGNAENIYDAYSASMDNLTNLNTSSRTKQWPKPSKIKNRNKKRKNQLPAIINKPNQDTDMSDITASQMRNEINKFPDINKETTTHKRSEIEEIIQQINEEINNKMTE